MGNLGMQVRMGYYVAYDIKAGADFGTRLASPGQKGQLGLPYHCGGVRKLGTALVPSEGAVPGLDGFLSADRYTVAEKVPLGNS